MVVVVVVVVMACILLELAVVVVAGHNFNIRRTSDKLYISKGVNSIQKYTRIVSDVVNSIRLFHDLDSYWCPTFHQ